MMLINGVVTNELLATDRAVQYGDGLFETIAVFKGEPRAWHRHMKRLSTGCAKLGIPQPDTTLIETEVQQLYKAYGQGQGKLVLKIIISRGSGGRGYRPGTESSLESPTRILTLYPWPEHVSGWHKHGVHLHVCETRLSCNPALAGIKHLNRIENVLASSEWSDKDVVEGLMRNMDGDVIEGTMSNIFAVFDGHLRTPVLQNCGVSGIMRARVIEAAVELGINVDKCRISLDELYNADEVFICNSIINIAPVRQLGNYMYVAPGAMVHKLATVTRDRE